MRDIHSNLWLGVWGMKIQASLGKWVDRIEILEFITICGWASSMDKSGQIGCIFEMLELNVFMVGALG